MANMGPVPKREEERRRTNKTAYNGESTEVEKVDATDRGPTPMPPPEESWHHIAAGLWTSAGDSVISTFYEPSDWAQLRFACEAASRVLKPQPVVVTAADGSQSVQMHTMPIKGADFTAITRVLAAEMFGEGDRRRLRLEIERETILKPNTDPNEVVASRSSLFAIK